MSPSRSRLFSALSAVLLLGSAAQALDNETATGTKVTTQVETVRAPIIVGGLGGNSEFDSDEVLSDAAPLGDQPVVTNANAPVSGGGLQPGPNPSTPAQTLRAGPFAVTVTADAAGAAGQVKRVGPPGYTGLTSARGSVKTNALNVSPHAQSLVGAAAIAARATPDGGVPGAANASMPALPPGYDTELPEQVRLGVESGDYSRAQQMVRVGLQQHPDDPALLAYSRLINRKVAAPDDKALDLKLKELGTASEDAGPQDAARGPQLAAALGFGGLAPQTGFAALGPQGASGNSVIRFSEARGAHPAVKKALETIAIGDNAQAEKALLRHLESEPQDALAWRSLALTQYRQKQYEPSLNSADRALALQKRDGYSRGIKIVDLLALDRFTEAENEATVAIGYNPRDAQAYGWRAEARQELGREPEALEDLKAAADIDPQFAALYQQALAEGRRPSRRHAAGAGLGKRAALWIGALGTAFLFFSFVLYRKRGDSTRRVALRQDDHDVALASAPRVDAVPNGFSVVKTLGAGGMGVVYEAVDLGLQRTVALKKMRDEVAANPRERARFIKEARVVAALRHPHIVEIYSIQDSADGLFLVFERVPGTTLHERLGSGALPPAEAVALLRQVAGALDYAHAQGVVHQDLKPANIMVHGGAVKVMDFGIARRVQETLSTMSRVEVAGTPAYMSPEQEQGGAVGPAADLFALGVCAYEMLSGRLPFPQGGLAAKAQGLYIPATQGTPLPKAVDNELSRALHAQPAARHASATAFVDALARALS